MPFRVRERFTSVGLGFLVCVEEESSYTALPGAVRAFVAERDF